MRVLHVTPYFAPAFCYGGPPRSILGLCHGLRRAGVEVEVFTTTSNGASDLPASPEGGGWYDGLPVRYFPRAFPRRLFGAARLCRTIAAEIGRYDLIHIHGLWNIPAWVAARQARRAGMPYVLSPRGMLDSGSLAHHARRKKIAYWVAERRNLAAAALLHATSTDEAQTLTSYHIGVPVVMLPNGLDVPTESPTVAPRFRQRLNLSDEVPLIVFIGRIHPVKRLDLLAAAFERVQAICGTVHLVIAGPDEGDHRSDVEALFSNCTNVHWTGELEESEKWLLLADATALVMCSDSESFGMTVLEALAAGVPVVVTRTCPWPVVETADCGFWVPQNGEAIARAMLEILRQPARAKAMGGRGRDLARERYSWDGIARSMVEQYREVIARGSHVGTSL